MSFMGETLSNLKRPSQLRTQLLDWFLLAVISSLLLVSHSGISSFSLRALCCNILVSAKSGRV